MKGGDSTNGFERYRRLAQLTQREVAEKLDVNQSTVSGWEQGCYPTVTRLIEIAKLYGCTIENLLEGQNIQQEEKRRIKEELERRRESEG